MLPSTLGFSIAFFLYHYFAKGETNIIDAIIPGVIAGVLLTVMDSYKDEKSKSEE